LSGKWHVTSFDDHSCDAIKGKKRGKRERSYNSNVVMAATATFKDMYTPSGKGGDARALQESVEKGATGLRLGKNAANRMVHEKLQDSVWHLLWDYAQLPDFIAAAQANDPSGYYVLERVPLEGHYEAMHRAFWVNGGIAAGFGQEDDFLGVGIIDGAHLKTCFGGTLLQVVALDANHHIVPLGQAIVPVENGDHCTWMLERTVDAFPRGTFKCALGDEGTAFMSQLFQSTLSKHGMRWSLCTNHVAENLAGKGMRPLVYALGHGSIVHFSALGLCGKTPGWAMGYPGP
jgi:hypothetical protein